MIPTFTEAQRALFARGFPHQIRLTPDADPDAEKEIDRQTLKTLRASQPPYGVDWPAQVAARWAHNFYSLRQSERRQLESTIAATPVAAQDVTERIARVLCRRTTEGGGWDAGPWEIEAFVFLMEAWHGSDLALSSVVSATPALANVELGEQTANYAAAAVAIPIGAMLLRATPSVAKECRAELEKILADERVGSNFIFSRIDAALNGKSAYVRNKMRWARREAFLFSDDPGWVAEQLAEPKGDTGLEPRAIWLAGEASYAACLPRVRSVPAAQADHVAAALGMLDSPHTVTAMSLLVQKKSAVAMSWLARHSDAVPQTTQPATATIEERYDALLDWFEAELGQARGDEAREAARCAEAAARFGEVRSSHGEDPDENMVHFFAADGIGFMKRRPTLWQRLKPSEAESARWSELLQSNAR